MRRAASFAGLRMGGFAVLGAVWLFSGSTPGYARITSITYTTSQPYGTVSLGSVGQYQELDGIATGTLDPRDPLNAIITDLDLAPRVNRRCSVFPNLLYSDAVRLKQEQPHATQ